MNTIKCLIIGSGPAGYTAAIYAARAGFSPVIVEGMTSGGQLTQTSTVENFPGFPEGVEGFDLMDNMRKQAEKFGTKIITSSVISVDFDQRPLKTMLDDNTELYSDTVIIATGATAKYLGLDDEKKFSGRGVSACATCDGFFFRKKVVAVVGGGDSACEEATYLSNLASKVYMIVRKPYLRASKIMQEEVAANEKIEILYNTNTEGLYGENKLEGARLVSNKGLENEKHFELPIDGFFLGIGHKPNSDIFKKWVKLDDNGYIMTEGKSASTGHAGVFASHYGSGFRMSRRPRCRKIFENVITYIRIMKLKLIIAAAVMAFGTINTASAQISNIFSKIKSAVSETLGTSSNNIEGTWVYSGADVEFTSDNILAQAGGKLTSSKIEKSINNALNKYGIAPDKLSLTFDKDSTYTCTYSTHKTQGTYTFKDGKLCLKPSQYSGRTITTNATGGSSLKLTCDADKVLSLAQMISSKVASQGQSSTLSIISQLAKNYKGMKVGLKFKKK